MSIKRLYYLLLLFFFFNNLNAQDTITLNTEVLAVKDGLSQGMISSVLQDKEGFMWFGTKDGLNKYDGYNFTIYRHEQDNPYSLPDNYVTGIVEDDNGNFWVGTLTKGLYLFDKRKERFYPVKVATSDGTLSNNTIKPVKYQDGKLLVSDIHISIYDVSTIHPGNYESVDLSKVKICFDEKKRLFPSRNLFSLIDHSYNWMSDNSLWLIYEDSIFVYKPNLSGIFQIINSYNISDLGFSDKNKEIYYVADLPQPNRFLFV